VIYPRNDAKKFRPVGTSRARFEYPKFAAVVKNFFGRAKRADYDWSPAATPTGSPECPGSALPATRWDRG
jgi:hypothetical protein